MIQDRSCMFFQKWDDQEANRLVRESSLLQYVKNLVEAERKRQLEEAGGDEEKIDEVNYLTVSNMQLISCICTQVSFLGRARSQDSKSI